MISTDAAVLVVESESGSVLMQGWDGVRVSATRNGGLASSAPLHVVVERNDATLIVRTSGSPGWVDLVIDAPARIALEAKTDSGDVVVRNTNAPVRVRSESGNVAIADVNGPVSIEAETGVVSLHSVRAPVRVATESGDVVAELLHSAEIRSAYGDISATVTWVREAQRFEARTQSGDVNLRATGGCMPGHVAVVTESGDVAVAFCRDYGAIVTASTESGDFSSNVGLQAKRAGGSPLHVNETFGNGEAAIAIASGSGSIQVNFQG